MLKLVISIIMVLILNTGPCPHYALGKCVEYHIQLPLWLNQLSSSAIRHVNLNDSLSQDHYAKVQGNEEQMNDAFSLRKLLRISDLEAS